MRPLTEQIILVTGATSGLGHHVASELAHRGAHVIAHGRDMERLRRLRDELGVETVRADFAALSQVDRLADELLQRHDRLDVLVNNAGIGSGDDPAKRQESMDGIELRFAVNYLAGYHLTRRLLPLLLPPARIVNVASAGQQEIDFADPELLTGYHGMTAYMRSKLAQVMFTMDLAEQLHGTGVTANALHPATFMDTAMVRQAGKTPISTVAEGARATLRLITEAELDGVSGRYFDGTRKAQPHPQATDPAERERLRLLSDELIATALKPGA
ncbi:NAD(P)-dependent dehydrogenase (short-subunit alcohol dehydrogenase family) [Saccharomonospora amisosensis]|uniref:NAD(P)-dependent dehydrogenase (Short-subunit alcohol dehydrogenase family) n=1 Tax=Saccharomonospora amisosensis TaxID=1128677 RepID=A0A7X5UTE2_9PSEU|nr:SDR family NAD(P)-dependent oxidoreductase [Saccharomonospora amisosensis]NIJ13911.1 NAD(P)-dependent dehydrogenase (short-subunit alcohol dehydrogenase family) [Saccharomonospora amisosensis]